MRNTHAHLNLSVYTVPVVQTLYVDDGTSSEDSGTLLATETIRAVTAGECGMERNLQKTRFYGKTEQVDELVDLATKVGLDRFAEELRQHGLAAYCFYAAVGACGSGIGPRGHRKKRLS